MATETILQHPVFTKIAWPFFLIFFIVFGVLDKTNLFGKGKKQLNAMVALVIALIFISVAYTRDVTSNLILFLTVALVVMFIALLLWGFVSGSDLKEDILGGKIKWIVIVVIVLVVALALVWAMGLDFFLLDALFNQSWSEAFWTNLIFLIIVAVAVVVVLKAKD